MLQTNRITSLPCRKLLILTIVISFLTGCTQIDRAKDIFNPTNTSGIYNKAYLAIYDFWSQYIPAVKVADENLRQINTFFPVAKIEGKEDLRKNLESTLITAKFMPFNFDAIRNVGNAFYDIADSLYSDDRRLDGSKYFNFAAIIYSKALNMKYDTSVAIDYANSCMYSNKYDTAEYTYQEVLKKEPNNPIANLDYGIFLLDIRLNKPEAEKYLKLAANQTTDTDIGQKAKQILDELSEDIE